MARTPAVRGGGADVATIEAISGNQAHVAEDFVQYDNITVVNEHGIPRRFQNLTNNLKSNFGIERIPFNGIDELDTEQGPNGEVVHAPNTGDSRIRFVGNGWVVNANNDGTDVRTDITGDYIEVTFYGTAFNLLGRIDPNSVWTYNLDGGADTNVSVPANKSSVLNGQNVSANEVIPVVNGLTAGIHTIRIRRNSTNTLFLTGCEVINESSTITQQPGADFSSNIELDAGSSFPINPDNTTVPSFNDQSGVIGAFTGTTGARVINYLTSSGELKQTFEPSVETLAGAGANLHTITFNASGAGAVTLPADVTSWSILTFGAGGGGGGAAFAQSVNFSSQLATASAGGGAGAGGGRSFSNFTKTGGTTTAIVTIVGAGTSGAGVVASGFGDMTATATAGGDGGTTSVSVGGTELISATGGGGGGGASAASRINDNVFTQATPGVNETTQRGQGTGADGAKGSTNITAADTINSGDTNAGDDARNAGGTVGARTEQAGFTPNEAGGTGGAGAQPGGSAGGNGATSNNGLTGQNGGATVGSIVLVFQSASGTALTVTNGTDVVTTSGAVEGSPFFNFGTTDHARQEIVRRINFREFGANNAFATLGTSDADNAFTLDDGTTTLVARDAATVTANGLTGLSADNNGAITITFVGTGLDVINNRTGPLGAHTVNVDGLSIGTLPTAQPIGAIPIVSGLAYGTHTVTFLPTAAPRISIVDFIIYGPKKPEIPTLDAGSLELSDYNIMADYVPTTVRGVEVENFQPSKGTIVKPPLREVLYAGTISAAGRTSSALFLDGIGFNGANSSLEYTFYGTDIDIVARTGSANFTVTVMLDGAAYTGAATVVTNTTTPSTWTPATSTWQQGNAGFREVLQINNLDLGVHTIRITGDGNFVLSGLFFHSPIHFQNDNLQVGSEGLNNLTIDPIIEEDERIVQNLGEAKAWINYDTATNTINGSYNISAIVETSGAQRVIVYFDKPFKDNSYICCPAIEPSGNTSGATIQIDRQPAEAGTRDSKTANGCTLLSNSIGTFTCSFFGELIDE